MKRLKKLKAYPTKTYSFDENGLLIDAQLEDSNVIKNYSGGIGIDKIHGSIKPLRDGYYKVLDDDIGGDAPKDFIQVYEYGKSTKNDSKHWDKHIAKVGHKWYPLESVSEHFLNRIGEVLDLNMASSQLRLVHGQIRFLSKYFLKEDEILVHGAQIYSACLLENDDLLVEEIEQNNWSRDLFTFQFTNESVKCMFPDQYETIMNHLVELLVFDAITGNNDRHFYNWAVITDVTGKREPRFSPIYDSARGMFWNRSEKVIERKFFEGKGKNNRINQAALATYLQSSRPKIGWEGRQGAKEINHFELIALINENYPQYKKICKRLINPLYLQSILKLLNDEFLTFYTPKRYYLITEYIKKRFNLLQEHCKIPNA